MNRFRKLGLIEYNGRIRVIGRCSMWFCTMNSQSVTRRDLLVRPLHVFDQSRPSKRGECITWPQSPIDLGRSQAARSRLPHRRRRGWIALLRPARLPPLCPQPGHTSCRFPLLRCTHCFRVLARSSISFLQTLQPGQMATRPFD